MLSLGQVVPPLAFLGEGVATWPEFANQNFRRKGNSVRPVIRLLATLIVLLSSVAHAGQGREYVNSYFELWLKAHNFTKFEKKPNGLFFPAQGVLLDGEIHEAKQFPSGKLYSVESRVSITFKDGRRLDDFVAGIGSTAEEAFKDSLQNFCLTTLHPIYAELFDHADSHVRKDAWEINGTRRRIFLSEWGQRGVSINEATQKQVEQLIAAELRNSSPTKELQWAKLVVLIVKGKVEQMVFTVNGMQDERITRRLSAFKWPASGEFTMAKLFFVIGGV